MKYIFSDWERIKNILKGKFIYLFLDYDGTLTPIVNNPKKAFLAKETKKILQQLSKSPNCKLAIVSGRALNDVEKLVGLKNIVYVGNHGFEARGPKIKLKGPIPIRYRKTLKEIKARLKKGLSPINGVFVEDKGFSLSVHYRLVDKKNISKVKTGFYSILAPYEVKDNVMVRRGKMILEVRPPVLWDKGRMVLWLLARQKFALRNKKQKVVSIYAGDDITDEDAFNVLGDEGLTICVDDLRKSAARYYLKNTKEVTRFLKNIKNIIE